MARNSENKIQNDVKWTLKALQGEVALLQREQLHLVSKSSERPLTTWEAKRLQEIFDELTVLLADIRSSGAHSISQAQRDLIVSGEA